jgi:hypothetical protein
MEHKVQVSRYYQFYRFLHKPPQQMFYTNLTLVHMTCLYADFILWAETVHYSLLSVKNVNILRSEIEIFTVTVVRTSDPNVLFKAEFGLLIKRVNLFHADYN